MLEDMEVGISDLQRVVFQITEARTDDLSDLQPLVCGRRWDMTQVTQPLMSFGITSRWIAMERQQKEEATKQRHHELGRRYKNFKDPEIIDWWCSHHLFL